MAPSSQTKEPPQNQGRFTWVVISEPIPEMRDKDDRLALASYEGLRVPLPLALLPEAVELEVRLAQLHAEFPWATRAIEVVGGRCWPGAGSGQ